MDIDARGLDCREILWIFEFLYYNHTLCPERNFPRVPVCCLVMTWLWVSKLTDLRAGKHFFYKFVAFNDLGPIPHQNNSIDDIYSFYFYLYNTLPLLESHLDPKFVIFNAGEKLHCSMTAVTVTMKVAKVAVAMMMTMIDPGSPSSPSNPSNPSSPSSPSSPFRKHLSNNKL